MTPPHLQRRLVYEWVDSRNNEVWRFRVDSENVRIVPPYDREFDFSYWLFSKWRKRTDLEIREFVHGWIHNYERQTS